ncbi:MAG: hypothetical protein ACXVC1_07600 [Tumebacillaceae bacterium]
MGAHPPTTPPPSFTPQQPHTAYHHPGTGVYAVDPGAIRPCRNRYVYIWLNNGRSFWAYPTYVGPTSLAGYRWNGRYWEYFGIDLHRIAQFKCY